MVHQELQPIPERSIAENMYLGRYPMKNYGPVKVVDHATMNKEAEKWLRDVKMDFNPKAKARHIINRTDAVSRDRKSGQPERKSCNSG